MNIEEPGIAVAIERAGDRLGYFHAGESNRGPLGTGTVDFPEAFAALDRIGYDGTELATSARRFVVEQPAAAAA